MENRPPPHNETNQAQIHETTVQRRTVISNESRALIINAIDVLGKTVAETASLFGINPSTVSTIKRTFYSENGRINKKNKGGNRRQLLSTEQQEQVLQWLDENCLLKLSVLRARCLETFNINPSESTLSRICKEFHFTLKRVSLQPERRNCDATLQSRQEYATRFLEIMSRRSSIFFIDESGFSCSMRASYGRSERGTPCVVRVPNIRTKNFSVCAAIGFNSLLCFEVLDRAYNSGHFLTFIQSLIQKLAANNIANAILIADNVAFHRAAIISASVRAFGHSLLFLPPYSPFLNPIENAFSQWKNYVKQAIPRNQNELISAIHAAARQITPENCQSYYENMETYIPRCLRGESIED
jgi:transposase